MPSEPKKFTFSYLQKMSRKEVEITNAFLPWLSVVGKKLELKKRIEDTIQSATQTAFEYELDHLSFANYKKLQTFFKSNNTVAVIEHPPSEAVHLLQFDTSLAKKAIYSLLSPNNSPPHTASNALTEVEKGILSYLLIKAFCVFYEPFQEDMSQFYLSDIGEDLESISDLVSKECRYLSMNFRLRFGSVNSYFRLFVDELLIKQLTRKKLKQKPSISRVSSIPIPIAVEVGRVELSPKEIAGLEPDDIVILENERIHLKDNRLEGIVTGRIGMPESASLIGETLIKKSGRYGVQIKDIVFAALPKAEVEGRYPDATEEASMNEQHSSTYCKTFANEVKLARKLRLLFANKTKRTPKTVIHYHQEDLTKGVDAQSEHSMGGEEQEKQEANTEPETPLDNSASAPWGITGEEIPGQEIIAKNAGEFETALQEDRIAEDGEEEKSGHFGGDEEEKTEIQLPRKKIEEPDNLETTPVGPEQAKLQQVIDGLKEHLVVELGRVNMCISEIASLEKGRIIELARYPREAVDLVVAGRNIGKGELVEVEGELGVRILSLVE